MNAPLLGVVICESDGPADSYNPLPTPKSGDGGLCFAGLKGAAVPLSPPGATAVTSHAMTVTGGATNVAYTVQVGAWYCSTFWGDVAYVDEAYAYWEADGHVGLINDDPAAPGGSSTSTAGATRPTGTFGCGAGSPIAMGGGNGGMTRDVPYLCPADGSVRVCIHGFHNSIPVGISLSDSPFSAAATIYVYTFDLPTGGRATVACPVLAVNGNPVDACALAGGVRGAPVTQTGYVPLTPTLTDPEAYLVDAYLDVTALGFGVTDVPVTVLCMNENCEPGCPQRLQDSSNCHRFIIAGFRDWSTR